ncbi:MAG: VWA domain-containing protein [Candidatus Kapaibacterium sp.]
MKRHSILQSLFFLLLGGLLFTACANNNETSTVEEEYVGTAAGAGGSSVIIANSSVDGVSFLGGRAEEVARISSDAPLDAAKRMSMAAPVSVKDSRVMKTEAIITATDIATGAVTTDEILATDLSLTVSSVDDFAGGEVAFDRDVDFESKKLDITAGDEDEIKEKPQVVHEPGQLTAGEWSDLVEWDFWTAVSNSNDWSKMKEYWGFGRGERISVRVDNGRDPISDAVVKLFTKSGELLWTARSDNFGRAELFTGLEKDAGEKSYDIVVSSNGKEVRLGSVVPSREQSPGECPLIARFAGNVPQLKTIDVMFVMDATGSMGDELNYIKAELESVITRVKEKLGEKEFTLRIGTNVYRDRGDAYVVNSTKFSENVDEILAFLRKQSAGGGGDTPEAVEEALADAIEGHEWSAEAQSRFLFLLLDAPPHYTDDRLETMRSLTMKAAAQGIRIIPVASSGIDKETEFLLRFLSIHTGGTYVFLTDHSGIGDSHIEPTIGSYQVEFLDDLLVRLIVQFTERPESVDAITGRKPELK